MIVSTILAIAFSTLIIVALCAGDPKRRRGAHLSGRAQGVITRRLLAASACFPALVLMVMGDAAAFLMWLGGTACAGWFTALWFSARNPAPEPKSRSSH